MRERAVAKIKLKAFDPAEFLHTPERQAAYLNEAFASRDPAEVADALGTIARARGMAKVAKNSGLAREALYRGLSRTGNPELGTVLKVMDALNLKIAVDADTPRPRRRTAKSAS